jgi:hypothetical protein
MTEVKIGRRGIEARLDSEGTAELQAFAKVFLTDYLCETFAQIFDLLVD